jgi:Protein of unknown function (DUF2905)
MSRVLIGFGILVIVVGLCWRWLVLIPWGRLPGDFSVTTAGLRLHFPLMSCLIVSVVVSCALRLFRL